MLVIYAMGKGRMGTGIILDKIPLYATLYSAC